MISDVNSRGDPQRASGVRSDALPVALTRLAPAPGRRLLAAVGDVIARRGRAAVLVLLCAGGAFLVVRGAVRLVV